MVRTLPRLACLLAVLSISGSSAAQPRANPRRTFAKLTLFGECHMENICGLGEHGGYASHGFERVCTRYAFKPDGSFTQYGRVGNGKVQGRYRLAQRTVHLTPILSSGGRGTTYTLRLSADGSMLGDLKREPQK